MAERFLILGASSFYGRNFAECVKAHGDIPILCDRYQWHGRKAHYIVNFASKSLVEESWAAPEEWVRANVEDLTSLVRDLCDNKGFCKFLSAGNNKVLPNLAGLP